VTFSKAYFDKAAVQHRHEAARRSLLWRALYDTS